MDIQRHIKNERRGITNMNPEKGRYTSRTVRRGAGITVKLLMAVVASIIIAVGALLIVVYNQMSHALLEKTMKSCIQLQTGQSRRLRHG